eukprot:COSAG06_NODE_394_length_16313_cov_11.756568_3_plen_76_part_00
MYTHRADSGAPEEEERARSRGCEENAEAGMQIDMEGESSSSRSRERKGLSAPARVPSAAAGPRTMPWLPPSWQAR